MTVLSRATNVLAVTSRAEPLVGFRSDILGLQAVAVLAVVAHNAFPTTVRGGSVGVDVFFVTFGYQICWSVLDGFAAGTFRFCGFYVRWIRHAFPALSLVLLCSYLFGWFVLPAPEYCELSESVAGGAAFVVNLLLWSQAGYCADQGTPQLLANLWPLGVAAQFCLVWPPVLYGARRLGLNVLALSMATMIASFALNLAMRHLDPAQDFYSPATRFWEFQIGGVLAYVASRRSVAAGGSVWTCEVMAAFGALLIGCTVLCLTDNLSLPGWWAAIPAAGSALLIAAGSDTRVAAVLSSRPLFSIGLISYPLYLWHGPLLGFSRFYYPPDSPRAFRGVLVLLSLVLAYVTYHSVERPLRRSPGRIASVYGLCAVMIAVASIGLYTVGAEGLAVRPVAVTFTEVAAVFRDWNSWLLVLSLFTFSIAVGWPFVDKWKAPQWVRTSLFTSVLFLGCLAFYIPIRYQFALDEAQWLFMSDRLAHGAGFADVSGNPSIYRIGYIAYYTLFDLIAGQKGAGLAPFIALAAFTVALFTVGRSLYGMRTAWFACGLYILTPRERCLTAQMIDGLSALLILIVFHLMNAAPKRNERRYGIGLGFAFFGAFLIKETALLILPLMLIWTISNIVVPGRQRAVAFYSTALLLLLSYCIFLYSMPPAPAYFQSSDLAFQTIPIIAEGPSLAQRALTTVENVFVGFASYFHNPVHLSSLDRYVGIIVLLPLGLLWAAVGAYRGGSADRKVLTALLCFTPLIAAVGWLDWRPEQCLAAIGLFYLLIARVVVRVAEAVPRTREVTAISFAVLAVSLLYQDAHTDQFATSDRDQISRILTGQSPEFQVSARGQPRTTAIIASAAGDGGGVWGAPEITALTASIQSGQFFPTAPIPLYNLGMPGFASGYNKAETGNIRGGVWGVFGPETPSAREPLNLLYREDLENAQHKVSAIVISPVFRKRYMPLLSMLNGRLARGESVDDQEFGPTWVLHWDPESFSDNVGRTFVDETALRQLALLRRDFPQQYAWYIRKLEEGGLLISSSDLDDLLADRCVSNIQPILTDAGQSIAVADCGWTAPVDP